MKDTEARIEKLVLDAADCLMIAQLTTVAAKRDAFQKLAANYRTMAEDLKRLVSSGELPNDLPK